MDDETRPSERIIYAHQVADLFRQNEITIPPLPKLLDELPPVRIFNVFNHEWQVAKGSLGTFTVPTCEEWSVCSRPLEIPAVVKEAVCIRAKDPHEGQGRIFEWRLYDGREVAADILGIGRFDRPADALSRYGVFVAAQQQPSGEEIEAARFELYKTCTRMVAEGNEFWSHRAEHFNGEINIGRMHQKAFKYLQSYTPKWVK